MEEFLDLFPDEDNKLLPIIQSPLNYTGSKSNIMVQLAPLLPTNIDVVWDLFCGGGGFFINLDNKKFNKLVANDIIKPLVSFYNMLQESKWEDIIVDIDKVKIKREDKDGYSILRERFNSSGSTDPVMFFMLCCCCTNNMMRFNKSFKFNQTHGKRTFNNEIKSRLRRYWNRIHSSKIEFTCGCFLDTIDKIGKDDFVYIDPPYFISGAGYNMFWGEELENKMYDFIDKLNSKGSRFMFSNVSEHKGNINPYMDRLKKYRIVDIRLNYDVVSRSGKSNSKEIVAINY